MPRFLIVSATKFEVQPVIERFKVQVEKEEGLFNGNTRPDVSILLTGVGMVNTAYYMGKHCHDKFDYILNAGVCGAINRNLQMGEVVNVGTDIISELGAEDGEHFIKYPQLNLGGSNIYENPSNVTSSCINHLKKVIGITVNTVHGNEESIVKLGRLYSADVESMEGAAFLRGCNEVTAKYIQLRSVSNYVEKRDKSKWQMPLAIKNLNDVVTDLIMELDKLQ